MEGLVRDGERKWRNEVEGLRRDGERVGREMQGWIDREQ